MPWIKVFRTEAATGFLEEQYDAASKRAGRIWNIVSIMEQNPRTMQASIAYPIVTKSPISVPVVRHRR
jgi:hypothetical protein